MTSAPTTPGSARPGALGMPPCIALTATATDLVRRDIADQLDLRDPALFISGFDRPNLTYRVVEARRDAEKLAALAQVLRRNPGSAIIYASSRKRCEDVGRFLDRDLGRSVVIYHAGLSREERTAAQDRFMGGEAEVVVATNAFGMGVDKPDIRSVVHFNMPGTIEAYYQEAGRAGRDGLASECVLLYSFGDRKLQEIFIENEYPPPDAVYKVYDFLRGLDADPIELTQSEIRDLIRLDLHESAVGTSLKLLEGGGALERLRPRENMAIIRINAEADEGSLADRVDPRATTQRGILMGLEALVDRRFGEPVYFHPDEFAAALGYDRATLTRTLRTLIHEAGLPIDYVPPFRGNAVRIFDRSRRPRDIPIDFQALKARKQQEYDKLERMIDYARTPHCRRAAILGYFGDSGAASCGRCDNCESHGARPGDSGALAIDTPAGREILLKILSGVARARGRFGKTAVAQMLVGSSSERMARGGLSSLSTYGILARSGFTQREVSDLIDALTSAGLVESVEIDRFKPVVRLSERGGFWVRGKDLSVPHLPLSAALAEKVRFGGLERIAGPGPSAPGRRDEEGIGESPSAGSSEDLADSERHHDPLWERLRVLRLRLAREARLSPAYVFSNETLDALVRERPVNPSELARIKGIGPSKLERFGSAVLEAIRAEPSTTAPPMPEAPTQHSESGGSGPESGTKGQAHQVGDGPELNPDRAPSFPSLSPSKASGSGGTLSRELSPINSIGGHSEQAAGERPARNGSAPSRLVPTEEWTWRLLDRGFTAEEAAAIRGLELATIIRHATSCARQGRPVPLSAFLPPDVLVRWEDLLSRGEPNDPSLIGLDPALWALLVACHSGSR